MSEQIHQNQNIPTQEELQARDDAIFNTVAEFHNELDNPELPKVSEYEGIGEDDASHKVDVDAIFDNRKAEISGRHRKAYSEEAEKAAQAVGMRRRAQHVAEQMSQGLAPDELKGLPRHRGQEDFVAVAMAKKGPGKKARAAADSETPAELTEDGEIDTSALQAAEEAARSMGRIDRAGVPLGTTGEGPEPQPVPTAPQRARHARRTPRAMADGQVGANHTGSIVTAGESNAASTTTDEGAANLGISGEVSDDETMLTPAARLRQRVATKVGKLVNAEQIRAELGETGAEIAESWRDLRESMRRRRAGTTSGGPGRLKTMASSARSGVSKAGQTAKEAGTAAKSFGNYSLDLMYRRDAADLTERERKTRPYIKGMAVASGALAVATAVLGAHNMMDGGGMQETSNTTSSSSSASPHASESAKPLGPQAPRASESASPSASASQKETKPSASTSATPTKKPVVGPSVLPSMPDFVPSPTEQQRNSDSTAGEQQQTKETDHDSISFTTKDGKVVRATATLKQGGSIFEAGHDAGLTNTQVANAVNEAGISSQRAEQLPVGQQINFQQLADGSYRINLR